MKKLLLGLGSVAATVIPVVSVIACGDNNSGIHHIGNPHEKNKDHDSTTISNTNTHKVDKTLITVNSGINFDVPDDYDESKEKIGLITGEDKAVLILDDRTGVETMYLVKPGGPFQRLLVKYGFKGMTALLKEEIKHLHYINKNGTQTAFVTSPSQVITMMNNNMYVKGDRAVQRIKNDNIFKRNFTSENIYTYVLNKGDDFKEDKFEKDMKDMFVGKPTVMKGTFVGKPTVTGTWDHPLDNNVSGVYTYTLDATLGQDRTIVKYRIRVYDSKNDQGTVLKEAVQRLKRISKNHKDPFSDTSLDKYQVTSTGAMTPYTQDKLRLNLAIAKLMGSENFHFLSPSIVGMFKDPTKRYSENKNWELSFKNIAVTLYVAYGINISYLPNEKMDEIKTAALAGTVDILDQNKVDKFFDVAFHDKNASRAAWRDHDNVGPFALFDKFADALVKVSNFSQSEMQSKRSSTSKIKNGKITTILNALWDFKNSSMNLIEKGDTIVFSRKVYDGGYKDTKIPVDQKMKEFHIFA
ncbi:MAG: hypothetical protein KAG14_01110 [Mycoplasmataceae bacterium]|nr:hypothetical protein [Mycoplasmataceae bacterium]